MYYDLGGRAVRLLGCKSTMNLQLSLAVVVFLNALQSLSSATRSTHMSDREKAGLRGPVRTCLEEIIYPTGKYLSTTEYSTDGRVLTIRTTQPDGSEWVTTNIYDTNGHLVKTVSGKLGEPGTEMRYDYDETGRLLTTTNITEPGNRTNFHYDEQGRKTVVQNFDARTLQRAQSSMYSGSPWDAAVGAGIGVPVGGKVTTIYDDNNQPTEAQIRDAEEHIVSRFVRTYDANGRMVEEKPIWENPILLMLDKFPDEERAQLSPEQIKQMNNEMGALLGGKAKAGTSYTYDAQNRITKMRERNMVFEKTTTILYNAQGDKAEERTTFTGNSVMPVGVPYSIDKDGTRVPSEPVAEVPASAGVPEDSEIHYTYQYDSYGNWTEQTVNHGSGPDEPINVHHRKLSYY